MNSENYIKIPSILQFRSLSYEKLSPTASSHTSNEKKTNLYLYDDIESPKLEINLDDVEEEEEKIISSPSPIPLIKSLSFNSIKGVDEKEKHVKDENVESYSHIPLMVKKMLTKEEMEMEEKMATQKGLIELGEQIANKKIKENEIKIRKEEFYDIFKEYVLSEEELENKDFGEWLEEKGGLVANKKQEWMEMFAKLMFAYSYVKEENEKKQNQIEDLESSIKDNDEQMNEYIKEIEELEEKMSIVEVKKNDLERIIFRLNVQLNQHKKDKIILAKNLMLFMLGSNLLIYSIQKYGLYWHYVIMRNIIILLIIGINAIIDIIYIGCMLLVDKVMNYSFLNGFIFSLAMVQLFQLTNILMTSYLKKGMKETDIKNVKKVKLV